MRQYTQQEINALVQAEAELRSQGLDVDGKIGEQNADTVKNYFEQNLSVTVTTQSIRVAVFGVLKEQLHWLTQEELAFNNIWATLSSQERDAFNSWVRPRRLIDNLSNNTTILRYLKESQRYPVDAHYLALASTQRIASQLEWEPEPRPVDPRQHTDNASRFSKDRDPSMRGGKKNHAYVEPGTKETPKTNAPVEAWESMTRGLLGYGSHSQQAALQQVCDQARASGKEWRQVYTEVSRLRASYERVTSLRGV